MPKNKDIKDNQGFCPQCKITKVIRKKNLGTMPRCNECLNINRKGRYKRTKEAIKAGKRLSHCNKDGVRYSVVTEHRTYLNRKLTKFGLTPEWYENETKECAICESKTPGRKADWAFDHDHNCCASGCSKCFRGILCHDCNTGIGFLKDNISRLLSAIFYLESYEKDNISP